MSNISHNKKEPYKNETFGAICTIAGIIMALVVVHTALFGGIALCCAMLLAAMSGRPRVQTAVIELEFLYSVATGQ